MRELDRKEGWWVRNWCFCLWCWRRLLWVLWAARRSNQSIPKEIKSKYSLEGLMLKLQHFGYLMQRTNLLEKTLENHLDSKEIKPVNPKYSLEGLIKELKFQYFGHLMWRVDSLENTVILGKMEDRRKWGDRKVRWLDGILTWWTWVWARSKR